MSLFQCEHCGCVENTALAAQGFKGIMQDIFDWSYAPKREGLRLCSACGPTHYRDGKPTKFGKWHNEFVREYLPIGHYETCPAGNLRHVVTGEAPQEKDYIHPA